MKWIVLAVAMLLSACDSDTAVEVKTEEISAASFKTFSPAPGITCVVWFANYFRKSDAISCVKD